MSRTFTEAPWLALTVAMPLLLAWNISPSTTFFNQALAMGAWGGITLCVALWWRHASITKRSGLLAGCLLTALAIVAASVCWTLLIGRQVPSIAWSALASCAAACCVACAGVSDAAVGLVDGPIAKWPHNRCPSRSLASIWPALLPCLVLAGFASAAVALIQVFAPTWPDGSWVAHSAAPGRAVGNLRQPNHLSSVLLWSAIALVGWGELRRLALTGGSDARSIGRGGALLELVGLWLCMALFIWAIVLTASRTGLVGVALLAMWGLADRRLSRSSRWLLIATPVMYAIAWWGMAWWAQASEHTFGGQQRLAEGDISGSRFRIWADALQLITAHPWTGVGWGNFNFAWSLTPFPNRHTAFFDHTHNLPLQLAVELGVPMALLICGLLLWALWQAWQRALAADPAASAAGRCAVMMIVLIGLHSLLEYPLWYAYFLLPTAFAWGFALGLPPAPAPQRTSPAGESDPSPTAVTGPHAAGVSEQGGRNWPLALAGALCVAGAVFSVFDYLRVADIFEARPGAAPLEQRIEAGKHSIFFAHHAHYAAATISDTPGQEMASFDIASHHLLDTRLMMAWAKAFAEVGDLERARHLADRLREFRNPASAEFFAECDKARSEGLAPSAWPFQCTPPSRALTWQDFLPRAK